MPKLFGSRTTVAHHTKHPLTTNPTVGGRTGGAAARTRLPPRGTHRRGERFPTFCAARPGRGGSLCGQHQRSDALGARHHQHWRHLYLQSDSQRGNSRLHQGVSASTPQCGEPINERFDGNAHQARAGRGAVLQTLATLHANRVALSFRQRTLRRGERHASACRACCRGTRRLDASPHGTSRPGTAGAQQIRHAGARHTARIQRLLGDQRRECPD